MTHDVELQEAYSSLTKHPDGSFRELWAISYPLMLVGLSAHLMIFIDRLILAHYSTEAMNGVVSAWMVCGVFTISVVSVAAIAEVFVGRFNGEKNYQRIGEPVWQMIWFSLMSFAFFIPLSMYGAQFFIPDNYVWHHVPEEKCTKKWLANRKIKKGLAKGTRLKKMPLKYYFEMATIFYNMLLLPSWFLDKNLFYKNYFDLFYRYGIIKSFLN